MIEAIENSLIEAIEKAVSKNVGVRTYPDNPSSYRPPHKIGEVLVRYTGSNYGNRSIEGSAQDRTMNYELVLVFRDLRKYKGSQGAYSNLEALRHHMMGVKLPQASSACQITSDRFVGESGGVWQWSVNISIATVVLRESETEQTQGKKLKNVDSYERAIGT